MERITESQVKHKFEAWCTMVGSRIATSYNDVGGYSLAASSPGDGRTRYSVEQIVSEGGGVRSMMWSLGTSDIWGKLDAGMVAIQEMRQNHKS